MNIGKNAVVAIDYTLTDDEGEVLDGSDGDEPLLYLHGAGQIVPGLETALEGRAPGDHFKVVVAPADAYGECESEGPIRVPRGELPEGPEPEVGMELEATGPNGETATLYVVDVEAESVLLSTDHPLAGVTLHFDVTVRDVREATSDEIAHGHAHDAHDAHDHG